MATSVTELANQALRRIGYKTEIGYIFEGSEASRAALTLYGQTRDDILRSKDWPFARRSVALALLKTAPVGGYGLTPWTNASPPAPWIYEYAYPTDCVEMRSVRPTPTIIVEMDPQPNVFVEGSDTSVTPSKVVLTNLANALAVYTGRITDMTQWEPMFTEAFVDAFGRRLAAALGASADAVKMQYQLEQTSAAAADRVRG